MLTNERAELLAKYLTDDKERAKALLELTPEDAAAKINADGFDFSVEEVKEFGVQLQTISQAMNADGELNIEDLDNVAGGLVVSTGVACALIGAGVTMFTAGVTFGYQVARDRGW